MSTYIKFKFDESSEAGQYFVRCAQIRQISLSSLFCKLQEVIAKDELVLSILDDDNKPAILKDRRQRYSHQRNRKANLLNRDH